MSRPNIERILKAMRADCVPAGECGRWAVAKKEISLDESLSMRRLSRKKLCGEVPPGQYTWLHCYTVRDEPALQLIHADLMIRLMGRVGLQGAWAMPRWFGRRAPMLRVLGAAER
jgi:hypothetical protein